MDLNDAIILRKQHSPRPRRWWRRRDRCAECRETWPCAPWRFARARITALLAEAIEANRGRHW